MSLAATTPRGPPPSRRPEPDRGVDRSATARRDGHVVTRLDEVPRHREPHRPEPDEPELHAATPPEPRPDGAIADLDATSAHFVP